MDPTNIQGAFNNWMENSQNQDPNQGGIDPNGRLYIVIDSSGKITGMTDKADAEGAVQVPKRLMRDCIKNYEKNKDKISDETQQILDNLKKCNSSKITNSGLNKLIYNRDVGRKELSDNKKEKRLEVMAKEIETRLESNTTIKQNERANFAKEAAKFYLKNEDAVKTAIGIVNTPSQNIFVDAVDALKGNATDDNPSGVLKKFLDTIAPSNIQRADHLRDLFVACFNSGEKKEITVKQTTFEEIQERDAKKLAKQEKKDAEKINNLKGFFGDKLVNDAMKNHKRGFR